MTPLGWLGRKTSTQTNKKHWYCEDLVWDCWWLNFIDFPQCYLPSTNLDFRFSTITWVNIKGFSPNLLCALILWRSALGLLMDKFHQFLTELSAHDTIVAGYYRFAFLFFHKSICSGYSLEPPHWGTSNEYPQYIFHREIRDTFLLKKVPYALLCSPVLVLPDVQYSLEEPGVMRYREGVSTTLVIC